MANTPILHIASIEIHLKRWSTADLQWGYTDCFRFVGEWITANGGPDLYSKHKYRSEKEALRCIKQAGFKDIIEGLDHHLTQCDPVEGCIIAAKAKNTKIPAMGIYHDGKAWAYGDNGKIVPMETEIIRAWIWQ